MNGQCWKCVVKCPMRGRIRSWMPVVGKQFLSAPCGWLDHAIVPGWRAPCDAYHAVYLLSATTEVGQLSLGSSILSANHCCLPYLHYVYSSIMTSPCISIRSPRQLNLMPNKCVCQQYCTKYILYGCCRPPTYTYMYTRWQLMLYLPMCLIMVWCHRTSARYWDICSPSWSQPPGDNTI